MYKTTRHNYSVIPTFIFQRHVIFRVSDQPQRTNTYTAIPANDRYKQCLFEWLTAHAPLWNQITYRRRQQYVSEEGDVWDADYTDLYDEYAPLLGTATCQQLARKNSEAWRSHFELLSMYHDESHPSVTDKPSPPGYWGNRDDGYELHGLVRNDLYTFDWGERRSTLEFGVGDVLEDKYGFEHNERLTLDSENTTQAAAIDVGANNTLAIVTEDGDSAVYHARPEFERFQTQSERIATLQSELPDDQWTSNRIKRIYDDRSRKRDHSRDAAVKHAAEWLLERNVDTVYVGDLTDVLDTHWSAEVNEKTHAF